jgi:hypothetical protein
VGAAVRIDGGRDCGNVFALEEEGGWRRVEEAARRRSAWRACSAGRAPAARASAWPPPDSACPVSCGASESRSGRGVQRRQRRDGEGTRVQPPFATRTGPVWFLFAARPVPSVCTPHILHSERVSYTASLTHTASCLSPSLTVPPSPCLSPSLTVSPSPRLSPSLTVSPSPCHCTGSRGPGGQGGPHPDDAHERGELLGAEALGHQQRRQHGQQPRGGHGCTAAPGQRDSGSARP